eukprot:CAMPEP_0118659788 /NCGR_PEP_ID=MMETSP0785-20121206/15307_1 /TAXON_ID=91992 /ORGANISM="Bolidomonas pacifica, Strain CCMP 1866" /LENGTH=152 /DNA_ID=CAMNT_0006552933 /DNA_START=287 /DNA_END=742 /DNA_ORIENTATION=+
MAESTLTDTETIEVKQTAVRYCKGSSYCFKLSTTEVDVMINTFGPKLGDVEWDKYYQLFYVYGCENMYGTQTNSDDETQTCAANGEVDGFKNWEVVPEYVKVDDEYLPVAGIDFNATGSTIERPDRQVWSLDYCCTKHYCMSSAVRRWGGGW